MTQQRKQLVHRMNRLLGHAQANKKMLEDGAYCIDIINQNLAVISALHKLNEHILDGHLRSCVVKAMKSNDTKRQNQVIGEILEIYNKSKR